MLSEHDLVRVLERVGRTAPVRFDEVTGSTQATALRMAVEGAPEWTLVAAGHQTQGRGRLEREWRDTPGGALLFSVVLRPDLAPDRGGLLTLLAGTALARACRGTSGEPAACKWPNDVQVGGRKVGGILAESLVTEGRFEHVVLGVGVNLGASPPDVPGAGAIEAGAAELLEAFLADFVREYRPRETSFAGAVLAGYRGLCATLGRRVRATTTDGEVVEGEAEDVDDLGGLVVRASEGTRVVRFGTVEHLG
jgi:BirA family biotin operon repressor/biotin-[acetyl-CoA-carboxylase] ligase